MKKIILKGFKKRKKIFKRKKEKVFTKRKVNSTIKKDYNPFEVNKKIYKRRDGLYMPKNKELSEIMKELNFIERIFFKKKFIKIYKMGIMLGFNNK